MDLFEKEWKIRRLGGKVWEEYSTFRSVILCVNMNLIPLCFLLGFKSPDDFGVILDIILSPSPKSAAREAYKERMMKGLEEGKVKLSSILSARLLGKEYPSEEERQKVFKREISRALLRKYKEINDIYAKTYRPSDFSYNRLPIHICKDCLSLSSKGLEIDCEKFLEIYTDFTESSQTKIRKQHQEVCNAINNFFAGIEVTQKELERYFVIEAGAVRINPLSLNREAYLRLGNR